MVWFLFLIFICLNGLDFYLTRLVLHAGGHETNPIIRTLYTHTGLRGTFLFKLAFTALIGGLVFFEVFLELEMIAANALYAIALSWMFSDYRLTRSQ